MTPQELCTWRTTRALSQAGLAQKLGILQHKLSRWESGKIKIPDDLPQKLDVLGIEPLPQGTQTPAGALKDYPRYFDLAGNALNPDARLHPLGTKAVCLYKAHQENFSLSFVGHDPDDGHIRWRRVNGIYMPKEKRFHLFDSHPRYEPSRLAIEKQLHDFPLELLNNT